jgi:nitrogen fixation protein NifU and related proteins
MNKDIYHDQIIQWSKKDDHAGRLKNAHCSATASNPLCGDRIFVELELAGDVIRYMAYQVRGCLLCKASSSILAERVRGLGFAELKNLSSELESALKALNDDPGSFPEAYRMFFPVRFHKSRHLCVLLPFEAVIKAVSEGRNSGLKEIEENQSKRNPDV